MRIHKQTDYDDGSCRITIDLDKGESLRVVREGHFYQLGGQLEDIVQAHVITEMKRVYWCSIEQKWVQA